MIEASLRHREIIVGGSIDRAILHLGLPAALAALLQAGFLVVDTFWLGRLGPVALAAASTAGFVMWLAQTLGDGLAMGSGAILAQAVGAGEPAAARRAAETGLALALWGSLLVLAAGLALLGPVFTFMRTAPEVTAAGTGYLRIILLGLPAYFAFSWAAAAFRAAGDAATPLKLLGVAAAVNLVLDPLLIFGLGPAPRLGVQGAAVATVASWAAGAAGGWWMLARLALRPALASVRRVPPEGRRALVVGLPLAAEGALFSLVYILLTRITTGFGTGAVAALGVGHKLEVLNYFVCAGMGAAATTLVGQSLGAGDPLRARRAAWRALFLTILPVGAVTVVLVAFPAQAVAVFSRDPAVLAAGVLYVLLVGLSQPFMAGEVVLLGAFTGAHRTTVPAVIEIGLTALRVPLAAALAAAGWGVESVWFAIASTTLAKGTVLGALWGWWGLRNAVQYPPDKGGDHDRAHP